MAKLEHLAKRGYTGSFYRRYLPSEYLNCDKGHAGTSSQQVVSEAIGHEGGRMTLEVKPTLPRGIHCS
jgi:hypothetical protein